MKCLEKARRAALQVIRLKEHMRSARIDLLFTMSDNTRASGESRLTCELISLRTSVTLVGGASARSNVWWSQTGSNRRPPACKAGALPTELWPLQKTEHGPIKEEVRRLSSEIGNARLHG